MNQPESIFRPIQLVVVGALALVIFAFLISSGLTWRELRRLNAAQHELQQTLTFERAHRELELELMAIANGEKSASTAQLIVRVDELVAVCPPQSDDTRQRLQSFRVYLEHAGSSAGQPMLRALQLLHDIAIVESEHEEKMLETLRLESSAQLRYELAAPLALLAIGAILLPITRRRIVRPLESFGRQISGLASGDFTPTPAEQVDSLTLPLHKSFIRLAVRLEELEREHRVREASLEQEVRAATSALLEQQRSLARAERLAVAGELAASVAHEVRNPLAGIQMSLTNIRDELDDPDMIERIDLLIAEAVRLARLVGELVDAGRHDPEPPVKVAVADLVDELVALTRYQLASGVQLTSRVEEGLRARLPKERLRQALLNLVLNSASAIGDASGSIEIDIASEGRDLRVRVSDDGIGFPDTLLESGVRPFYSTRNHGTGLGLAMVRRFVRDVEGRLELSNRRQEGERRGACVSLLLPSVVDHA